ncbi:hypothetical protein [Cryobacterium sp. PH31-L1]|uniref:hypothetical protein n=1 Tax=Cryobacterium sp. PH31-L1 TaxID=3046199 RepID=UPI0032D8FA2C
MPISCIKEGLGIVQCDPHVNGQPWPYAPRVILKRAIAELAARNLQAQPTVMLFVRNPTGVSRSPEEYVENADAEADARALGTGRPPATRPALSPRREPEETQKAVPTRNRVGTAL